MSFSATVREFPQRVRIATRRSRLALWQAEYIRTRLCQAHPGLPVEIREMNTRGDKWLDAPLSEVGGKGLFVKELEQALLDGKADIAVHSMKDVPAVLPRGFCMPVIAFRDDVRDALVSRVATTVQDLPPGAVVGSSSLRRKTQLLHRRPDLDIRPVRGNVGTRLQKLDEGNFDAIVLAAAGLKRLNLENRISQYFSLEDSLPAAGQGALGIECLNAAPVMQLLQALEDADVFRCVSAERKVTQSLGGDCFMPVAAHCELREDQLSLTALLSDLSGTRILHARVRGNDWQSIGEEAARRLFDQGAAEILRSLNESAGGP